jgi:hypothetical protein
MSLLSPSFQVWTSKYKHNPKRSPIQNQSPSVIEFQIHSFTNSGQKKLAPFHHLVTIQTPRIPQNNLPAKRRPTRTLTTQRDGYRTQARTKKNPAKKGGEQSDSPALAPAASRTHIVSALHG